MKDQEYIIKYLEEKFDSVHHRLERIEDQTIKTNGRVGSLESFRAKIMTYGSIVVFAVPYFVSKYL